MASKGSLLHGDGRLIAELWLQPQGVWHHLCTAPTQVVLQRKSKLALH